MQTKFGNTFISLDSIKVNTLEAVDKTQAHVSTRLIHPPIRICSYNTFY